MEGHGVSEVQSGFCPALVEVHLTCIPKAINCSGWLFDWAGEFDASVEQSNATHATSNVFIAGLYAAADLTADGF